MRIITFVAGLLTTLAAMADIVPEKMTVERFDGPGSHFLLVNYFSDRADIIDTNKKSHLSEERFLLPVRFSSDSI